MPGITLKKSRYKFLGVAMSYVTREAFKNIEDPDLRACALVGYFLQAFALMENRLDALLTRGLSLKSYQGTVLAKNIDLRRKVNIARVLADLAGVSDKVTDKLFGRLHGFADERNTAAHEFFVATKDGKAVEFFKAEAKNKLKYPEAIWSVDDVISKADDLLQIGSDIDDLANQIDPVTLSKLLREPTNNALLGLMLNSPDPAPREPTEKGTDP